MNKKIEKCTNKYNDYLFWCLGIMIIIFSICNQQYIQYHHIFIQFIITIASFMVASVIILRKTNQGLYFCRYWMGAVAELKKVTWPSKEETMRITLMVLIMVLIVGLILWTVDSILIKLVAWLLQKGEG